MDVKKFQKILFFVISLALSGAAIYQFYDSLYFVNHSQKVTGYVLEVKKVRHNGKDSYRPIIGYEVDGKRYKTRSKVARNLESYPIGSPV